MLFNILSKNRQAAPVNLIVISHLQNLNPLQFILLEIAKAILYHCFLLQNATFRPERLKILNYDFCHFNLLNILVVRFLT